MSRTQWAGFNNLYCAAGPLEWLDISVCVCMWETVKETDHEQCYMEHSGFLQQAVVNKSSFIDVLHAHICHTVRIMLGKLQSGFKFIDIYLHKILRLVYRFIFPKLKLFFIGKLLN